MDNAICWWTFCEMTESFKRDDGKRRAIKKKEVLAVKKKKTKKNRFSQTILATTWFDRFNGTNFFFYFGILFRSPAGDTLRGIATLCKPHNQDVAHSRCWEGAERAKQRIEALIIQGRVGGLMASRQTGRYEGRRPMCFPAESLLVSWMWKSRGRQAVFRPGGSLKINRRIHWGLSFLSLRLNEVVCTWCVCMGGRLSGVLLHFNEVLPTPLSCHFDHTVTYELMRMHT